MNDTACTKPATSTAPYPAPHDVSPEEPHPFEFPIAVPGGAGGGVGDGADPQPAPGHRINLVGDRGQAQDPLDVPDNVGPVHRAEPHELSGDIARGVTHGQVRRARGSVWKSGEKPQEGPRDRSRRARTIQEPNHLARPPADCDARPRSGPRPSPAVPSRLAEPPAAPDPQPPTASARPHTGRHSAHPTRPSLGRHPRSPPVHPRPSAGRKSIVLTDPWRSNVEAKSVGSRAFCDRAGPRTRLMPPARTTADRCERSNRRTHCSGTPNDHETRPRADHRG